MGVVKIFISNDHDVECKAAFAFYVRVLIGVPELQLHSVYRPGINVSYE